MGRLWPAINPQLKLEHTLRCYPVGCAGCNREDYEGCSHITRACVWQGGWSCRTAGWRLWLARLLRSRRSCWRLLRWFWIAFVFRCFRVVFTWRFRVAFVARGFRVIFTRWLLRTVYFGLELHKAKLIYRYTDIADAYPALGYSVWEAINHPAARIQ